RRFTVRIRFNRRDANAALARPGMSVETAVAVSTADNASPTERGNRVGCEFDPSKDIVERSLTKLPEHPGLGRARPQGPAGTETPIPARPEQEPIDIPPLSRSHQSLYDIAFGCRLAYLGRDPTVRDEAHGLHS